MKSKKILKSTINRLFLSSNERSLRAKRNIIFSFLIKGSSILLGLISMPLTINYLDTQQYGVYITLTSLIAWFSFFDIGLGGGLRNRFAEAIASGNKSLARVYVSTTYVVISTIIIFLIVIFFLLNNFIEWNNVLNINNDVVNERELSLVSLIVFTSFCLGLVLRLITTILNADQKTALASTFDLFGKIISILLILILINVSLYSLLFFTISQSLASLIVLIFATIYFFRGKYRIYRPSLKYYDPKRIKDLLGIGIKFFVITISNIILYQTNNIIISQLFGPSQVTNYSVVYAYFGIITMSFSMFVTPLWSAFTEAWVKNEISWIKGIVKKLKKIWILHLIFIIIMIVSSKFIFSIWVGDKISVSYFMSTLVATWIIINAFNSIYNHFLNGVGIVNIQIIVSLLGAIMNIPLALYLGVKIGIEGVLISNIITAFPGIVIYPFFYKKVISKKSDEQKEDFIFSS
jgi:O-antigen/teichoic acid export membrane protein